MRSAALLSLVILLAVLVFAKAYLPNAPTSFGPAILQIPQGHPIAGDGEHMWTRAEIRVLPLDLVWQRKVQLDSLRAGVAQATTDNLALARANPQLRENVLRDINLMYGLLSYIDGERSDEGKSIAAMEVQRHLNEIEGRVDCSACHTSVIASSSTVQNSMVRR